MSKKSTVKETRIWNTEPHPQYGFTFDVTMENGDVGRVGSKTNPMTYFVVGSEVEYEMEEKNKTDGSGTYIRIKKPSTGWTPGGSGGGSGWKPKDAKAYKADSITMCLKYGYEAAEKFADDPSKLDPADIKKWFEAFVGYAHAEIDKLFA